MGMRERGRQDGFALLLVLIAALVILSAVALVVSRLHASKQQTDASVRLTQLEEVCKAGIDLGVQRIWNEYVVGNGNTTGNLASYRVFVDNLVENNEDLNGNGQQDAGEFDSNGNGLFEVGRPVALISEDAPRDLPGVGSIVSLTVARTDDVTGTLLTLRAVAQAQGNTRAAVQTVRVSGQRFEGFEFAVLANNINCILCHATIEPLDLFRNGNNSANYGTFDRIKIASLESMMIRTNENINTLVAGSAYCRGQVYNHAGSLLSGSQIASSTFKGYNYDRNNGKLIQDAFGDMSKVPLVNANRDPQGRLEQFANLYLQYPTAEEEMTDGNLPTHFPAPFPDDNGNRNVDNDEFMRVVNSADGSIQFLMDPNAAGGSITAGVAYGVPAGSSYSGNNLPNASNGAINDLSSSGSYRGNLILIGSDQDPIVINRKVAVDGDLIIKGKVKGWGQLLVRGNVYVAGDVTYADAPGYFGMAEDGTPNGFALTAGGSILMGDYLTIRGKNHSADTSKFPSNGYLDVRTQHITQKVTMGGKTETLHIGYFDQGAVDAGWTDSKQPQFSFTTSELMLFNRMEKLKAQADPTYQPRYYRLRPTQPIYEYVANDEHAVRYDDAGVRIISNTAGATIHNLSPTGDWISEDQLRKFWYADEMTRPSSGRPWLFDGLLYSNNSIFGITRSSDRHKSNTRGMMTVRGGLVAADLGMLVPGPDFSVPRQALKLYYDRRVADFLRVEDTTQVEFTRLIFRLQ